MKHRLSVFVVFAFVVVLLMTPLSVCGESQKYHDLATNSDARFTRTGTAENKTSLGDGPRQHAVLWDTTHGVYLDYQPFVRYTDLVALLADSGYTMDCCGTGVHTVDLSLYDVIVICTGSSWNSQYTQEEVDSLVSYYDQGHERVILTGDMNFCENIYLYHANNLQFIYNVFDWLAATGGILIMGENTDCPNGNFNPVANAFHMTAGISYLTPADLYFTDFAAHPLFDNVSQIYFRAAGEISVLSPAEVIARTDNQEPVIAVLDEATGIEKEINNRVYASKIQIVPNPFMNWAEVKGITDTYRIKIYDVSGSLVEVSEDNMIGNSLKQGIYFLKVEGYEPVKILKLK